MFFCLTSKAQEHLPYISLKGNWHFSIGDNPDWARYEYNHYEWEKIFVPSAWEQQGFNGYDGFAWYRKEVQINPDAKDKSLWLELGFIDDADQVFFNGELINSSGSFPPNFKTAYNAQRNYKIPSKLIRYDQPNVIAVRVYDAYNEGGIISGNIQISYELNPLKPDLSLEGKWKFKTDDKSYYKAVEYNDSNWDEIMVPRAWEEQGYDCYDGMAWYRTQITLPDDLKNEHLVLLLGMIDDVDECYVNGILIGNTGEISTDFFWIYGDAYKALRGYYIPTKLHKNISTLTIAVRVQDKTQTGGIYKGPVGIIKQSKYVDYWTKQRRR